MHVDRLLAAPLLVRVPFSEGTLCWVSHRWACSGLGTSGHRVMMVPQVGR